MTAEKRLFLALLISMIFCTIWAQYMRGKQKQVRRPDAQQQGNKPQKPPKTKPDTPVPQDNPKTPPKQHTPKLKKPAVPIEGIGAAKKQQEITIDTDKYRMEWTNCGACLRSVKFKEFFHDNVDRKKKNWQEDPKNWLEVIPEFTEEYHSMVLFQRDNNVALDQVLWQVKEQTTKHPCTLVFEIGPIGGVTYVKKFTFPDNKYFFQGKVIIENHGKEDKTLSFELGGGAGIVLESKDPNEMARAFCGYTMAQSAKKQPIFEDYSYSNMSRGKATMTGNVEWAALINRYFGQILHVKQPELIASAQTKAFRPDEKWVNERVALHNKLGETPPTEKLQTAVLPIWVMKTRALNVPAEGSCSLDFDFHIATKLHLSEIDKHYEVVNDYGFFGIISRLLLIILGFFYNIFHSYGIAIICLTLVIKLCLFPLTRKQQVAMQKYQQQMRKFQPQMKKLQEKYKGDKQKLNQEVMKLYKDHGINPIPLGGCLPIFLQLPIFIGLYQALYYSLSLRQAPFLWITDLAQPDRLFQFGTKVVGLGDYFNLLPILMTVVWIVQQSLAPKPEDPQMQQQQKMFMFMSVIFAYILYDVAAGLVLYWLVMNMFSIVEQLIIKKTNPIKNNSATTGTVPVPA